MQNMSIVAEEVLAIPVTECFESLVSLKHQNSIAVVDQPDSPNKNHDYYFVRRSVYKKLTLAQSSLPSGIFIRVFEGLRTLAVQQMEFEERYSRVRDLFEGASDYEIFVETTKLVSPVTNFNGTVNIPPHATGAAIDVDLIDANGDVLDFGMELTDWNLVDPRLCETRAHCISDTAQRNRAMLLEAMQSAGFVNYYREWWHYSYGDKYWACHTGKHTAIYDIVTDEIRREM